MKNKTLTRTICTLAALLLIGTLFYSDALAWSGGRRGPGRSHWSGRGWRSSWPRDFGRSGSFGFFGFQIALPHSVGNIVVRLPIGYSTVRVKDATYYRCDDVYYKKCPTGYIIVPESEVYYEAKPARIIKKAQIVSGQEAVTINVLNANGSYTPITLVRYEDGYIGPQGEYYPGNPTVEQLRALYGK